MDVKNYWPKLYQIVILKLLWWHFCLELIDQVLAEDDQDNDGYLSYVEYVIGKQREQTKQDKAQRSLSSNK